RASFRWSRELRRRRPDEPVLHQELRLLSSPPDEGDGVVVELVPGLADAGDALLDRLHADRGGLPRKDVDLLHRWHDVLLVEPLPSATRASSVAAAIHISSVIVRARTSS